MPIDYSKFDGIGEDEDEEVDRGSDLGLLLEQCMDRLKQEEANERLQKACSWDPGSYLRPLPPNPDDDFDFGYGLGDELDLGMDPMDGFDDAVGPSLDMAALREEASQLALRHLVARPGGVTLDVVSSLHSLLLEAELFIQGRRYHQALLASLALQLISGETLAPGEALLAGNGQWALPASVVEMICCYQLGDRVRAVALRDCLQDVDRSMLSKHLAERFEGTSEVLEFVPQFLSYLKETESRTEKKQSKR
eukprot:TRINITY_DN12114_c0_g1_i1.p1 TRINITY_DN12114_c0_g1~~TRINITY_DN12114_c0_g1_i1.p1  ORF type:complete len:251 (-),score=49.21 TRINITY_DN12114_c0_g1_i1:411-1163(-)